MRFSTVSLPSLYLACHSGKDTLLHSPFFWTVLPVYIQGGCFWMHCTICTSLLFQYWKKKKKCLINVHHYRYKSWACLVRTNLWCKFVVDSLLHVFTLLCPPKVEIDSLTVPTRVILRYPLFPSRSAAIFLLSFLRLPVIGWCDSPSNNRIWTLRRNSSYSPLPIAHIPQNWLWSTSWR